MKTLDVVCIGHALLDILAYVEEDFLANNEIRKTEMRLVDSGRQNAIYQKVTPEREVSGGSAANTAAGIASLGGKVAYLGNIREDQFGKIFAHDLRSTGVIFDTPALKAGPDTGTSLILITPDAERSMLTHLGIASHFDPKNLDEAKIRAAKIVYLEGYIMDTAQGRDFLYQAAALCRQHQTRVALTLSDPWLVDRHRDAWHEFVKENVDILFANQEEATSLFKTSNAQDAIDIIDSIVPFAAVTFGPAGSVLCVDGKQVKVEAYPVARVEDTTGAGDLYAAGVLYGLAQGKTPVECGRFGSLAASEIVSHIGARPEKNLRDLARQTLAA